MNKQQVYGWLMGVAALGALVSPLARAEQVCNERIPPSAPDSNYADNGDGTITDRMTGLIWKQCPEGLSGDDCQSGQPLHFTWQEALQHAATAVFAGSDQWRVPNVKELASLVELRCMEPSINLRVFPNTAAYNFWSSTTYPNAGDGDLNAYGVRFVEGNTSHYDKRLDGLLRLVRDDS